MNKYGNTRFQVCLFKILPNLLALVVGVNQRGAIVVVVYRRQEIRNRFIVVCLVKRINFGRSKHVDRIY